MDDNGLVLPIKPSRAVLELSPAEAVSHEFPNYGSHCAEEQHDEVVHRSAITDISLVEVCNPDLFLIHGCISVQVPVPVVTIFVA
jgi:hypothetical protein